MKLYYPKSHYNTSYRSELFPLLKPFIKEAAFTDEQRIAIYGVSAKDFEIADTFHGADVCILPMSWNYYMQTHQLKQASEFITESKTQQKIVWSFISGDHGLKILDYNHVVVFRLGGYQSKHLKEHQGLPVFIEDYLSKHHLLDNYLPKEYNSQPVVGFCGQANSSKKQFYIDIVKKLWFNLKSICGLSNYETETLLPTSFLRAKLLKCLRKAKDINDCFVLRKQYRAGVITEKQNNKTTLEFYNNILDSHYILCVRGCGNFSVRFYETLMMGRIPIYVNTDGFLPFSNMINWKQHVVWVEPEEQQQIAEKVLSFHSQLTPESFFKLCESNRKLWENKLTLNGFFKTVIQ